MYRYRIRQRLSSSSSVTSAFLRRRPARGARHSKASADISPRSRMPSTTAFATWYSYRFERYLPFNRASGPLAVLTRRAFPNRQYTQLKSGPRTQYIEWGRGDWQRTKKKMGRAKTSSPHFPLQRPSLNVRLRKGSGGRSAVHAGRRC